MAQIVEVGFARQGSSDATDGIFDAALLPWRTDIAEEGLDAGLIGERVMKRELWTVVACDGAPHGLGKIIQHGGKVVCGSPGLWVFAPMEEGDARGTFMGEQDGLTIACKEHEGGFPMAWHIAICSFG